ncbi:cytochrome P450 [Moorena producens PAL-8-15-08-1]|uniref:Cytochrome P450 n=1 Tax=Moorena producens PAL-8-15-08-1 TaxID=1458985 RepID=A0A1D8TRM1_9CYAN|nr:cytochrome P450 [Moorena producens]AOX00265.1 cytochrome P450 [Moorena producens PAL-8-15-08-1]
MNQQKGEVTILSDGQATPAGITKPPRQGRWYDTFSYIANPEGFCHHNLEKYGPIFNTGVFGGTTIFVGSSRAIQMVFNGDSKYTEIALPKTTMDMFGEYSLFQRPELHRERKSALKPGLTGRILEGYIPRINEVITDGLSNWSDTVQVSLYPAVEKICFQVLVPLLLGVNLDDINPKSFEGLPLSNCHELKSLYKTYFDGFYGLWKWKSPLTAYGRGLKARAKLLEFMGAVIGLRRASKEEINPKADFLSMMLASQQQNPDGIFSDSLIENQCLLQLWASHYEISGLVSSLIYQLGRFPQVLDQLRSEQATIVGEPTNLNTFLSEQLKQMVFLEAVIKETLRTLPPSSTANRRLTKSVVLDGMLYAKGCTIIAEPRLAHIMPEHFHQPELFEPERFLPPQNEGRMYEFIPFGGGVHACLGAQMAMTITKIFASHLIYLFDWQLTGEASFVQFPLKKIKNNYQIILQKRW